MKTNNINKSSYSPLSQRGAGGESWLGVGLLTLKSLWSRRKRNVWLFLELILVAILCWAVLDPVIVSIYDKSLPLGYDKDRLCLVTLDNMDNKKRSNEENNECLSGLKQKLMHDFPEIERMANSRGYLPTTYTYGSTTFYNDTVVSP